MVHIPVLQKEVIKYLDPKPNENFIDTTINGGGHALAILNRTQPNGKLLGIDWDEEIIKNLKFSEARLVLVCDNFVNLKEIVKREKFEQVSGILFDLGMSSWHLDESNRGFSFQRNEPLDMRYNPKVQNLTAEKIVNYYSFQEIEKILREYGEESFSERIATEIIELRKAKSIENTAQLVEIVKRATPGWYQRKKIHPATKIFQALRIAVNEELNNLKNTLPQALEILKRDGKLAVISFHSLEDRMVKNFFSASAKEYGGQEKTLEILTKKPIIPSFEEIKINPRSRSAKLRVAIKI